jgi:hypothetical protein
LPKQNKREGEREREMSERKREREREREDEENLFQNKSLAVQCPPTPFPFSSTIQEIFCVSPPLSHSLSLSIASFLSSFKQTYLNVL